MCVDHIVCFIITKDSIRYILSWNGNYDAEDTAEPSGVFQSTSSRTTGPAANVSVARTVHVVEVNRIHMYPARKREGDRQVKNM